MPFSPGWTATCVEAIWQGLKVFERADVDVELFRNDTMKHIKTHRAAIREALGGTAGRERHGTAGLHRARKEIYVPTYRWMLEHKVPDIIERLRTASRTRTIVLLDYDTNSCLDDGSKPLSHAYLVKAYVEGLYPYGSGDSGKGKDGQLTLFD